MCELSDFYLELIKQNSTRNPKKPPIMLKKEDYRNLMTFLSKQGKRY